MGVLVLTVPALIAQEGTTSFPTDPIVLVKQAAQLNSLSGKGMRPWRLKATLHAFQPAESLSDEENKQGKYEELWAADEKSMQVYSDEEYSQTVYVTSAGRFITGGMHFVLGEIGQLHEFFEPAIYLHEYADEREMEFDSAAVSAGEAGCIRTFSERSKRPEKKPLVYRFCFDSSLRIVRFSINGDDDFLILFRNPLTFRGQQVPTEVELRRHGVVRIVANLESLETADDVDNAELVPPADAVPDESGPYVAPIPRTLNVSAGVAARMLLEHGVPVYPPKAKAAHISGTVVVRAAIMKDGTLEDLHVISGPAMLRQAALDAVAAWRYRPYLLNGEPVEVGTTINVIFKLADSPGPDQRRQ